MIANCKRFSYIVAVTEWPIFTNPSPGTVTTTAPLDTKLLLQHNMEPLLELN